MTRYAFPASRLAPVADHAADPSPADGADAADPSPADGADAADPTAA